jgi:hypothetical protein
MASSRGVQRDQTLNNLNTTTSERLPSRVLTSEPIRPAGSVFYNRTDSCLYYSDGLQWLKILTGGAAGGATCLSDADGDTSVCVDDGTDNDVITMTTTAMERMRIDSSGNVGIGTTMPTRRLHYFNDAAGAGAALFERATNDDSDRNSVILNRSRSDVPPGAGFGTDINWSLTGNDGAGTPVDVADAAEIRVTWDNAQTDAGASRDASMYFDVMEDGTPVTRMTIHGDTTASGGKLVTIPGDLEVTGVVDPTALVLEGQTSAPVTPSTGDGSLWVDDNASPSTLMFTDDLGTDHNLTGGGGGGRIFQSDFASDSNILMVLASENTGYDVPNISITLAQDLTDAVLIFSGSVRLQYPMGRGANFQSHFTVNGSPFPTTAYFSHTTYNATTSSTVAQFMRIEMAYHTASLTSGDVIGVQFRFNDNTFPVGIGAPFGADPFNSSNAVIPYPRQLIVSGNP